MSREYTGKVFLDREGNLYPSRREAIIADIRRSVDPDETPIGLFFALTSNHSTLVVEYLLEASKITPERLIDMANDKLAESGR